MSGISPISVTFGTLAAPAVSPFIVSFAPPPAAFFPAPLPATLANFYVDLFEPNSLTTVRLSIRDVISCRTSRSLNFYFITGQFEGEPDTATLELIGKDGQYDDFERFAGGIAQVYAQGALRFNAIIDRVTPSLSGRVTIELVDAWHIERSRRKLVSLPTALDAPLNIGAVNSRPAIAGTRAAVAPFTTDVVLTHTQGFTPENTGRFVTQLRINRSDAGVFYDVSESSLSTPISPAADIKDFTFAVKSEDVNCTADGYLARFGAFNSVQNGAGMLTSVMRIGLSFPAGSDIALSEIDARIAAGFMCAITRGIFPGARFVEFKIGSLVALDARDFVSFETSNISPRAWKFVEGSRDYAPRTIAETTNPLGLAEADVLQHNLTTEATQPHAYYVSLRTDSDVYVTCFQPTPAQTDGHIRLGAALHLAQQVKPRQVTVTGVYKPLEIGNTFTLDSNRLSVAGQKFFIMRVLEDLLTQRKELTGIRIE